MIILFLLILLASVINIVFDIWLYCKIYRALKD